MVGRVWVGCGAQADVVSGTAGVRGCAGSWAGEVYWRVLTGELWQRLEGGGQGGVVWCLEDGVLWWR